MDLTIIVDNHAGQNLRAEHGFSLLLEAAGRTILFDTGDSGALLANLQSLDKDPARISDLVLSHGHYDHSGGVKTVLSRSANLRLYMHPAARDLRYSLKDNNVENVHMPQEVREILDTVEPSALVWVEEPFEITPEIGLTGSVGRVNTIEDTGGAFFLDESCRQPDPIADDMALWVRTSQGLVVCVGCSHAGIINTLDTVISLTGCSTINTVIGGLHLLNSSDERLHYTAAALNSYGITQLVCCHCTGDDAFRFLSRHLACTVIAGHSGMNLSV